MALPKACFSLCHSQRMKFAQREDRKAAIPDFVACLMVCKLLERGKIRRKLRGMLCLVSVSDYGICGLLLRELDRARKARLQRDRLYEDVRCDKNPTEVDACDPSFAYGAAQSKKYTFISNEVRGRLILSLI